MSAGDRYKSLHAWATERFCGRRIVFHHVPKCAGTSVARTLRRAYLPSQATVRPEESGRAFRMWQEEHGGNWGRPSDLNEMMLLYLLNCDVRCIAAHVPFSNAAFDGFHDRYAFVTILRDPVDRFISNYFWSKSRPGGHQGITLPLEDYVETPAAVRLGATFVRYFCGRPGKDRFDSEDVAAAITNLRRMDAVGFLDQLGSFEERLRQLTGRRLRIGQENVRNTKGPRDEILSGPLRDRILALCAPDRQVWDAVQDLRGERQRSAAASV